jgi:hypothetical protein
MIHAAQHSQEMEAAICKGKILSFISNKYELSPKQINLTLKASNRFQNLLANAFVKYHNFGRKTTHTYHFRKLTTYNTIKPKGTNQSFGANEYIQILSRETDDQH